LAIVVLSKSRGQIHSSLYKIVLSFFPQFHFLLPTLKFPPSALISKSLMASVFPSIWIVELCIYIHIVNYLERAFNLEILANRFSLLYLLSVNISFSSFRGFDLFIIGYLGK
jgi:hypothetical protein